VSHKKEGGQNKSEELFDSKKESQSLSNNINLSDLVCNSLVVPRGNIGTPLPILLVLFKDRLTIPNGISPF
jgi:hypothetical protein